MKFTYFKIVREHAAGLHHLVEGEALVVGGEHEHHAARLKAPAVDDLAWEHRVAALLVHVEHHKPVFGNDETHSGLSRSPRS